MAWFGGIVALNGQRPAQADHAAMADVLRKRGYDVRSISAEAACFLEWKAPRDAAGGAGIAFGDSVVLCDSRIDNLGALRERLRVPDADAPVVFSRALAGDAELSLDDVVGEFAVAIWHGQARRLMLARDRLGGRPLYYCRTTDHFFFSTDLPVLLAIPSISKDIDVSRLAEILAAAVPAMPERTVYEAIRVLPGGHTLALDGNQVVQSRYCRAPGLAGPAAARTRATSRKDDDHARALREHLTNAVSCRLAGGRRIAVHLSGGLDSSAIACIAARQLRKEGRRLIALCSVLPEDHDGAEADEYSYMHDVLAQEENIDPVWIRPPTVHSPFSRLAQSFACLGHPVFTNVSHIEASLGEAGQRLGVDVVLNGFGGDFFASWRGNLVLGLLKSGRLVAALGQLRALHRQRRTGWWRTVRSEAIGPLVRSLLPEGRSVFADIVEPGLLARLQAAGDFEPGAAYSRIGRARLHDGWRYLLEPGCLELVLAGTMQFYSRSFGQELRMPMLDQRVIDFMFAVPAVELQSDGVSRSLFRRAMTGILPERIRQREDKGAAFDPALMSRLAAARDTLTAWARDESRPCWKIVNRHRFLETLDRVQPSARAQWRADVFPCVLMGGALAAFIDWHAQRESARWN